MNAKMKVVSEFYQENTLNCSFVKVAWVSEYVCIFQLVLKMGKGLSIAATWEIASEIKYDLKTILKLMMGTKMQFL